MRCTRAGLHAIGSRGGTCLHEKKTHAVHAALQPSVPPRLSIRWHLFMATPSSRLCGRAGLEGGYVYICSSLRYNLIETGTQVPRGFGARSENKKSTPRFPATEREGRKACVSRAPSLAANDSVFCLSLSPMGPASDRAVVACVLVCVSRTATPSWLCLSDRRIRFPHNLQRT